MALNYSTQTYTHPSHQLPLFGAHQISPADSATNTPSSASPTSPRSHTSLQYHLPGQARQLRPMKSPLYVPAALRPTERPSRNPPTTPPKSLHGSLESLEEGFAAKGSLKDDTRKAPLDLVVANNWIADEELGQVTGEPTKEHWKVSTFPCQLPAMSKSHAHANFKHQARHLSASRSFFSWHD